MPYRTIHSTGATYAFLAFDSEGLERNDTEGVEGRFSRRILEDVAAERPTDIFVLCHGWKGDVPAAIEQYDRWIAAMDANDADRAEARRRRPGFKPFRIGVHWPSQPWGDEELGSASDGFFGLQDPVELYASRFGDRPGLKDALSQIFAAAARDPAAEHLPPDADAAYRRLDEILDEMGSDNLSAPPDEDREPFDPQVYFRAAREEASFGFGGLGGILAPLRQLSFWKMKQRSRAVGESGLHAFLAALQRATHEEAPRIHLMGHSFGCIVVSAMLCGPMQGALGIRQISSLALVQGALSLWSYCDDIPIERGRPGYFSRLVHGKLVRGPIVVTRSVHDKALGRFYPLGAGVANQIDFAAEQLPRYGAIGSFGAKALQPAAIELAMTAADRDYAFENGRVHNVEASSFVRDGAGASGAHSDIDGPEVAHLIWSAALAET